MATQTEPSLDLREQIARIDKTLEEIAKTRVEVRKITVEAEFLPRAMIFQAMLATAALLGAGAAIAKLFFP